MTQPIPSQPILTGDPEAVEASGAAAPPTGYQPDPTYTTMSLEEKQALQDRLTEYVPLNPLVNRTHLINSGLLMILFIQLCVSVAWAMAMSVWLDAQRLGTANTLWIQKDFSLNFTVEAVTGIGLLGFSLGLALVIIQVQIMANQNIATLSDGLSPCSRPQILKGWLIPGLSLLMPCLTHQSLLQHSQPDPFESRHDTNVPASHHSVWFWWFSGWGLLSLLLFLTIIPFLNPPPAALLGLMIARLFALLIAMIWMAFFMNYLGKISRLQHRWYQTLLARVPAQMQNYEGLTITSRYNLKESTLHQEELPSDMSRPVTPPLVLPENPKYRFHLMLSAPMSGPFLMTEIYHHLKAGNIHAQVLCRRDHDTEFTAIREIEEFQWIFKHSA